MSNRILLSRDYNFNLLYLKTNDLNKQTFETGCLQNILRLRITVHPILWYDLLSSLVYRPKQGRIKSHEGNVLPEAVAT